MTPDGRSVTQPYRIRVGSVWYWVDPTVPVSAIEPGDTVVIYPAAGEATLSQLSAFILLAIGVQIVWGGLRELIRGL